MWNNETAISSKNTVTKRPDIQSFGHIMNIIYKELKTRNLEYAEIQNANAHGDKRLVFDILTEELNSGKQYVVHVDYIQLAPNVEQFLDCVYGSGSTSDLKIIIFDDNRLEGAEYEVWTELYFVTRLINKCNALSIPFDMIGYNDPLDKSMLTHQFSLDFHPEAVESYLQSGALPTKWDIQRTAFWSIFYNTNCHMMEQYNLHRLQPDRSLGFRISGDLDVFVKWVEDEIFYVITDSNNSEFIPWLWKNREKYFKKDFPDRTLSNYRDGVNSSICLLYSNIPIHKLESMSSSALKAHGSSLFSGASNLRDTVYGAYKQYKGESEQMKDISIQ